MNKLKYILILCCLLFFSTITAQILEPAKWQFSLSKQDIKLGDSIELVFTIQLDDTWHLYSNDQNYEIGPLPTSFEFEPNNTYKLIGDVVPIRSIKKYDEVFEVDVNYFEHTAEFRQKVKILSKNPVIKGFYEYQVCSSLNGRCMFAEDNFDIIID